METSVNLYQKLWAASDDLRSQMDANEYKNYLLGIIFYKYLSDKMLDEVGKLLEVDDANLETIQQIYQEEMQGDDADLITEELKNKFSFVIGPDHTFTHFIKETEEGTFQLDDLGQAFNEIERSDEDYIGLFEDIDLYSNKLGKQPQEKNKRISNVMKQFAEVNFANYSGDVLGDVYGYMLANFASESGKKAGEFYTPQAVSRLMAMIAMDGKEDKQGLTVFDPTLGSGSLLLQMKKQFDQNIIDEGFFGQEINMTNFNLARMNMFLHNVNYNNFSIKRGDTLLNPLHNDEKPFDAIVSNPPYSIKWIGDKDPTLINDERFAPAGKLAPKSYADYAFIMHSLSYLSSKGRAAIVCFPGIFYKRGAEKTIRKYLVDNNFIDCVIQLPENLFFGTSIATCILVMAKNKTENKILFIDASKEFKKETNNNILEEKNIQTIVKEFRERKEVEYFSKYVDIKKIEENDYNLSVSTYVEKEDTREKIDINVLNKKIEENVKKINELRASIDEIVMELLDE